MWSEIWRDLRLAARTLRGSPMFTLTAVLSLAIGIGGTAVIFGVVDTYLIRPMARHRSIRNGSSRSAASTWMVPGPSTADGFSTFSYPNYQDYLRAADGVSEPGRQPHRRRGGRGRRHKRGARVGRIRHDQLLLGAWDADGARAELRARGHAADRSRRRSPSSAISLWRSQFGGDANIIGRTIQLNGRPFTHRRGRGGGVQRPRHRSDRASGCR